MKKLFPALLAIATLIFASCGGSSAPETATEASPSTSPSSDDAPGIRLVNADEANTIFTNPPADLVVLDVRTPEEFAEGHLEGAIMIDFYDDDFADQLAELDPSKSYLLYCRSGNRSGQTTPILKDLGFDDVADLDGGIGTWISAGLPVTQ
ncbi:MAG: rhodanese-like domain-containing protein [Acidimicrobiales bacterium]